MIHDKHHPRFSEMKIQQREAPSGKGIISHLVFKLDSKALGVAGIGNGDKVDILWDEQLRKALICKASSTEGWTLTYWSSVRSGWLRLSITWFEGLPVTLGASRLVSLGAASKGVLFSLDDNALFPVSPSAVLDAPGESHGFFSAYRMKYASRSGRIAVPPPGAMSLKLPDIKHATAEGFGEDVTLDSGAGIDTSGFEPVVKQRQAKARRSAINHLLSEAGGCLKMYGEEGESRSMVIMLRRSEASAAGLFAGDRVDVLWDRERRECLVGKSAVDESIGWKLQKYPSAGTDALRVQMRVREGMPSPRGAFPLKVMGKHPSSGAGLVLSLPDEVDIPSSGSSNSLVSVEVDGESRIFKSSFLLARRDGKKPLSVADSVSLGMSRSNKDGGAGGAARVKIYVSEHVLREAGIPPGHDVDVLFDKKGHRGMVRKSAPGKVGWSISRYQEAGQGRKSAGRPCISIMHRGGVPRIDGLKGSPGVHYFQGGFVFDLPASAQFE